MTTDPLTLVERTRRFGRPYSRNFVLSPAGSLHRAPGGAGKTNQSSRGPAVEEPHNTGRRETATSSEPTQAAELGPPIPDLLKIRAHFFRHIFDRGISASL